MRIMHDCVLQLQISMQCDAQPENRMQGKAVASCGETPMRVLWGRGGLSARLLIRGGNCIAIDHSLQMLHTSICGRSRAPWLAVAVLWPLASLSSCSIAHDDPWTDVERYHCDGSCPSLGATARLSATLHGSGAHRHMLYHLAVSCPGVHPDATARSAQALLPSAAVAIVQPLPPAVFADVYQLDNAAAVGLGPQAKLFGPVDVESIEKHSSPTTLVVYAVANLSWAQQARRPVYA